MVEVDAKSCSAHGVQGRDPVVTLQVPCREHELVHAQPVVGQVVHVAQAGQR